MVFALSIRDLHGKELVGCTVDYGIIALKDMIDLMSHFLMYDETNIAGLEYKKRCFRRCFARQYGGATTKGQSISQIRQSILALGYSEETRTLSSWFSVTAR